MQQETTTKPKATFYGREQLALMDAGGYCVTSTDGQTEGHCGMMGSPGIHRCMCVVIQALMYAGGVHNHDTARIHRRSIESNTTTWCPWYL